jgi:peptidyl-prolyl cis-trans isomerase SurA
VILAPLTLATLLLAAPAEPAGTEAAPAHALATSPSTTAASGRVVDRVAAVVNGEVVTLQELRDRAGEAWRRADQLGPGPERDMATRLALRRAYDVVLSEKLFHAQAVAQQLEVNDAQVDAAIEDIKKRNRFDDRQLDLLLAEQGMDRATFRAQILRELESMQLLSGRVRSRIKVSDEDLRNYYQSHQADYQGEMELRVRHIFLPLAEEAAQAEVERVTQLGERTRQRLLDGEDFATVAKEVSRGPGAEEGGDLGWLRRGTIQKQLEDVAFGLADGQVSKLARVGPGLHLFQVVERRHGGARTFEQAKDDIRDILTQEQTASYRDQYLAELKRDAVIELNLAELKD